LNEVAGVNRSYAYCVQPLKSTPEEGTHKVTIVDDDDTGKISLMRKLIYYLPGAYGYTKVTKKRWFENNNTGVNAYALGHLGLSWVYSNYSEGREAWADANDTIKSKVKSMVKDLSNLADPPDSFEVFWVKVSGNQDVFGAFYLSEYGNAKLVKTSSNAKLTGGNNSYSLAGAQYTIFEDEDCKVVAKNSAGKNAVITTKADGSSDAIELETGVYYIKETKAPKGFTLDKKVRSISISKDKTTTITLQDAPVHGKLSLLLRKEDRELEAGKAQGDASLAGAVYKISYYDGQYSSISKAESSGSASAVWYFSSNADGEVVCDEDRVAAEYSSSDFFRNEDGDIVFLLGTYVIQEVKAPGGYMINTEKLLTHITEGGSKDLSSFDESVISKDDIIRGGVKLSKIDHDKSEAAAQGDASLENAEFTIYNKSEKSVMINGKEVAPNEAALVMKTNKSGAAESGNDALPYGTYLVKETKPSQGYLLNSEWSKTFQIRENTEVVDLSEDQVRQIVERGGVQIVKNDKELEKSEALGAANLEGIVLTIRNTSEHDVVVRSDIGNTEEIVDWKKTDSKKELFESEQIKTVKPGEDIGKIVTHWNEEQKAYTAETLPDDLPYGTYTIRESKTTNSYQRTDKTEHRFEVRENGTFYTPSSEDMEKVLTFENYVYRSDVQGTKIGDGDSRRFSYVPFKITSVSTGETHVIVTDNNGFFSTGDRRTKDELEEEEGADTARKINPFDDLLETEDIKKADLQTRSSEMLMGVWFGTGKLGSIAEITPGVGALPYDSYVLEELRCDENAEYTLQKFFFIVDEKSRNGIIDLETITDDVPFIDTKASVNGSQKDITPDKEIILTDVIEYEGLKRLTKYTAKGRLVDKQTGETVKDAAGNDITAEKEFTTLFSRGKVKVEFKFDAGNMYGKETVVFETLYDTEGHLIAKHEDINSESQTVTWEQEEEEPSIPIKLTKEPRRPDEPEPTPEPTEPPKADSPKTGDVTNMQFIIYLAVIAVSLEILLLTVKRRNDRLN